MFISILKKYKYFIIILLVLSFLYYFANFLIYKTFVGPMLGYTYNFKIGINYDTKYKIFNKNTSNIFEDSTKKNEYLLALNSPNPPPLESKEFYNSQVQEKFGVPALINQESNKININLKGNLNNNLYYIAHNGKTGFTPFNLRRQKIKVTKLDCRAIETGIGNVIQVIFRGYEDKTQGLEKNPVDVSCELSNLPKGQYFVDYYDLNVVNYENFAKLNQGKIPDNYWLSTFEVK